MKTEIIVKKFSLVVLLSLGSILWLNVWHRLEHEHGLSSPEPVLNWLRDALLFLLPVMAAVWFGGLILQRWLDRSAKQRGTRMQIVLSSVVLGGFSTLVVILMESNNFLHSAVGNDFALKASLCRALISNGSPILDLLSRMFSTMQLAKMYVALGDFATLTLVNAAITSLWMLTIRELKIQISESKTSFKVQLAELWFSQAGRTILVMGLAFSFGGLAWMQFLHETSGAFESNNLSPILHWLRDAGLALPAILIAILLGLTTWRSLNNLTTNATVQKSSLALILSISVTVVFMLGVPVHHVFFDHSQPAEIYPFAEEHDAMDMMTSAPVMSETGLWDHAVEDGLLSLPVNLGISLFLVFFLDISLLETETSIRRRQRIQRERPVVKGSLALRSTLTVLTFLATPSLALSMGPAVVQQNGCVRTIYADVVALDQQFYYNRLGAWNPAGMIYALRRDVVDNTTGLTEAEGGALNPGQVSLRSDKRPRPLVLRANIGDCLEIHFTNLLSPIPVSGQLADRNVGISVNGLRKVGGANSGGSFVGRNSNSLVGPGESTVYTLLAEYENTYLLYDMGLTSGGEAAGGSLSYGLFGAVNVEPSDSDWESEWYRSQLTRKDMDWATPSEDFTDLNGNGKWDYAAIPAEPFADLNNNGVWDDSTTAETLVDVNGNGIWDDATEEELFVDVNHNDTWDAVVAAEPFEDMNGNSTWDAGEPFTDVNENLIWDDAGPAEEFTDANNNGQWDAARPAESFVDANGNGIWDTDAPAEEFTDENANGVWDPAVENETFEDLNGNGEWDAGTPAESFTDANGNGTRDEEQFAEAWVDANNNGLWDVAVPAEAFEDLNNNQTWDPEEIFTDTNNDGVWNDAIPAEEFTDANSSGTWDAAAPAEEFVDENGDGEWNAGIPGEPLNDLNGNGRLDLAAGEPFVDSNGNGAWDAHRTTPGGQPILDYDAVYPEEAPFGKAGLPIIGMLAPKDGYAGEIVHSDINAIITGPGRGDFPNGYYPADAVYGAQDRSEPFREFTVIFHDEVYAVQAFPQFYEDPALAHALSIVKDGFAINYGTGGIGSEIIANRLGVGPMANCVECKYEEFFLTALAVGDPAMIVDTPADLTVDPVTLLPNGERATKALYPDDPSNVHHSYMNDHIKFRQLHAGPKEHHIFHLHAHQWQYNWNDPNSNYLDSQGIGPGSGFTYEIAYGGSGNRNKAPGDSIFHCHFYPHFAMGMWELWRTHDTFEIGTELSENGVPVTNARALPDGEILAGTPIPGIVPLPSSAPILPNQGRPVKAMAPMPDSKASVVPFDGNSDGILDSSQYDLDSNGVADLVDGFTAVPDANPGFPFYIPGVAGHRPPTPALDIVYDGGLPRHIITGGQQVGVTHEQYQTRLDFNKELLNVGYLPIPETGTPAEVVAMQYHEALWHESYLPDGTPVSSADPIQAVSGRPIEGFETNGLPPQPGAPFADPCRVDPTAANGWAVSAVTQNKIYKGVNIQIDLTMNKVGWHFPQQRILTLWDDAQPVIAGSKAPEPLVMRLNAGDCASYWHANLVPNVYELDDYQVRTPTDIIGQHIHLVKFDVTSSDGSANGFNYEDGTLSPMEVQERIHAITANGCSNYECPQAEVHPFFGPGPDNNGDGVGDWVGARTTVQRWYADAMLNSSWDNGLGTVFTHDHYGPSTHQQVGLYATVLIEPSGAQYRDPETGTMMGTRHDGGPTSWRADIINIYDSTGRDMSHREFYFEFADFQHAYLKGGGQLTMVDNGEGKTIPSYADFQNAINPSFRVQPPPGYEPSLVYFPPICPDGSPRPCPEAISGDDPGTYVVNYRNEPIAERVYDPATKSQAAGQAGDLAYAFSSLITRAIPELNQVFNAYPSLTQGVEPNDPATPLLRVYMGDKVRLRVQVGAHEEEHNFMIHGLKWKKEPLTGNSGWKDAEFMGISEYAIMEMPILPDIGPGTPHRTDYLYTMGAQVEDYWNGIWGVMRSYNKYRSDLKPLPNNPIGTDPLVFTNESDFNKVCPIDAPMVNIKVTAVRAADVLPGGTLVYNDRSATVTGPVAYDPITGEPIQFGPVGQGPLHDPSALMYFRNEDLVLNAYGKPAGLKPGVPVEPLILRARAGDCIKLQLTNALPANLTWTGPDGNIYPDMPGFSTLPSIVHKSTVNSPEFGNGLITFNANDLTPSSVVGLHPQLVSYNVREADGFAAGRNALSSIVSPGQKKTYIWYAGDIDMVPDTSTAAINDYKLVATPVEFGATGLLPADRIKGSNKGLVGALVIEPLGSTWVEDPASRAAATVIKADGSQFREFVTIIQNDINFRYSSNVACQPSLSNLFCAVHSIASEGGFTPEDPQDSAQKAINYGADPLWFRMGVSPETPFEGLNDRTDLHSLFSNTQVGGDPQTAVYMVSPYGPDQVRMRVVAPGGHARGIVYTLDGHSWQRSPYINNSTEIGENWNAWWTSSQEGIGAGSIFDMVVSTGSDPNGDYLFRDFASFGSYQGLWGLMRKDASEPMGRADIYTTAKNTVRTISAPGVLKNDVDLDGDAFTAQLTSGTRTSAGGTVTLGSNGSFKYTPPTNFTGTDSFQYKICSACGPTTVSINVGKAPVSTLDSYSIIAGTPSLTLAAPGLLVNDKDPDGDPFILGEVNGSNLNVGRQITLSSGSTLMVNEDGSMIYEAAPGFAGKDTFTYAICENLAGGVCSNVVTDTIKVNAAPSAVADIFSAKKNTKLTTAKPGVMSNDVDLNLDTLKAVLVTNPASGTLTFKTDGSFAYTPAKNFVGTVLFTYKVCETSTTELLCSNVVTATITVK